MSYVGAVVAVAAHVAYQILENKTAIEKMVLCVVPLRPWVLNQLVRLKPKCWQLEKDQILQIHVILLIRHYVLIHGKCGYRNEAGTMVALTSG